MPLSLRHVVTEKVGSAKEGASNDEDLKQIPLMTLGDYTLMQNDAQ